MKIDKFSLIILFVLLSSLAFALPPATFFESPTPDSGTTIHTNIFTINCSSEKPEAEDNLSAINIYLYNSTSDQLFNSEINITTFNFFNLNLKNDFYTFNCVAYVNDVARGTEIRNITIDIIPPEFQSPTPTGIITEDHFFVNCSNEMPVYQTLYDDALTQLTDGEGNNQEYTNLNDGLYFYECIAGQYTITGNVTVNTYVAPAPVTPNDISSLSIACIVILILLCAVSICVPSIALYTGACAVLVVLAFVVSVIV